MDEQGRAEAVRTDVEADEAAEEFDSELGDAGKEKDEGFIGQNVDL